MKRNEGGLPTKCQAQTKKNRQSRSKKGEQKDGTKMTCSGSARAHCKASGCICLKKEKKKKKRRGRDGGRKGVFIDEGMECLRPREMDRSREDGDRECAPDVLYGACAVEMGDKVVHVPFFELLGLDIGVWGTTNESDKRRVDQ